MVVVDAVVVVVVVDVVAVVVVVIALRAYRPSLDTNSFAARLSKFFSVEVLAAFL